MYQTSEEFNEKVKSTGRTSRAKLKIGDTEITSGIRKISHVSGSCGSDSFSIGSVFSAYADIELQKTGIEIQGKTVEIYFGLLLDDGTVEYAKKGTFVAEKPEGDTQTITFHAQDNIARKCNGSYVSTLTFPTTIKAILDDIASQTGITYRLNGLDASGQITVKPEGYVCVDVLGYMACCMGGFVYCDADGVVVLSSFDVSGTTEVTPNLCWTEPTIGENQYTVGGLTVVVSESTESEQTVTKTDENGETYEDTEYITVEGVKFTYGSGGIAVTNPFMTQELFDAIKEKVVAISFRPGTVEFFGDARLDPTDAVQVTTLAGETFTIPCMNIVQEFDGGLTTTVSAPTDKNSDGIEITGPIGKTIKKIEADIIIAKEMTLNRLTVEDLRTRKLTATNLHITGDSTFDGVLNGATGTFAGDITAKTLSAKDSINIYSNRFGPISLKMMYLDDRIINQTHYPRFCIGIPSGEEIYTEPDDNGFTYFAGKFGGVEISSTLFVTESLVVSADAYFHSSITVGIESDASEHQVKAQAAAGTIYLYSQGSSTGLRGLYGYNSSEQPVSILNVASDNTVTLNGHASKDLALSGGTVTGNLIVNGTFTSKNGVYAHSICRPADNAGNINLGSNTNPWYNLYLSHCVYYTNPPTGGGTAVYINSNGAIVKYSSDRRLKNSIAPVEEDTLNPERLYDLPIYQYKYNNDVMEDGDDLYDKLVIGIMADEVESIYPAACAHDANGEPTGWNGNILLPAMLKLLQDQKTQLENQMLRIKKLENLLQASA